MDVTTSNDFYLFTYDPSLYDLNTAYWRELNGAPGVTGSEQISLNGVTIVSKHQYFRGDLDLNLIIPTAPAGGDDRIFGFVTPGNMSKNAAYFQITNGGVFQAVVIDSFNGTVSTYVIPWNAAWTATATDYFIRWNGREVQFMVNGLRVAWFADRNLVPQLVTLPIYLHNNNTDNMLFNFLEITNVQKVVMPEWENPVPSPTDILIPRVIADSTATSESVTVTMTQLGGLSVFDLTATSENYTVNVADQPHVFDATTTSESIGMFRG